jgi:iron(III) transport system substrate-binding protein
MRKLKLSLIVLCLLLRAPIFGQTEAKVAWLESVPPLERETRLVEAAKKEGQVVAYANLDVTGAKALADGFRKKYPSVNLQMVHFSGAAIINRLDTEARAGKVIADVVLSGQLGMLGLLDKKVVARYKSPQRDAYREGFKDKDGLWTAMFTNLMVSSYNTRFVKKDEAPRKVEDLLNPHWKGKLAMDTQSYVWFGTMLQFLGEEQGLRFMKRLNEQEPTHIRGRRHMNELLAAGEFDMVVETNLNSVLTLSKLGAPLWFAPIRPLFLSPSLLMMAQNAPHPNAAALLIDYFLSEEGQRIIVQINRMPANSKVKPAESQLLEGLDIRMPDVLDIGTKYNALGKQYREIFPASK